MREELPPERTPVPMPAPWRQPLADLERTLHEAARAIAALRHSLEAGVQPSAPTAAPVAPLRPQEAMLAVMPQPPAAPAQPSAPPRPPVAIAPEPRPEPVAEPDGRSAFERLWERLDHERLEQRADGAAPPDERRGLALLPQQYLITVDDREGEVELVSLHRALLMVTKMEDISLVSFANGTPVVSLRVEGQLDIERLRDAVSLAMDRACEMIEQGNNKIFLRLRAQDGGA